jgi:fibronectin-binding autotransporter adhesin
VDGGPYSIYADRPETSDSPPSTQTFTDTDVPVGHTYSYEIVAENVSGFSTPAYASVNVLGSATLSLNNAGKLVLTVAPGAPDRLSIQLAAGIYTLTDPAVTIAVTGAAAAFVTGGGTSAVTIPAAHLSSMTLDTSDNTDIISIISDAVPIIITADSGSGKPIINLGDPTNNELISGNITNASNSALTIAGSGTTTVTGNLTSQGSGGVTLAGAGTIEIAGNINLGPMGNLIDSGSGPATISGKISGAATSGFAQGQGLIGTYFNLPAAGNLIQPADAGNPAWLGNQTPAVTAQLVGPIDFPDIADNGFADSVGNSAYYNIGGGNNNVEARWYGNIMIPGTGTAPVPINFATTSDDGSMLYVDGSAVVNNNNFQGAAQATGIADLTPGLHTIDVEYYQGGGAAVMDAQWDPTGGTNFVDIPSTAFSSIQAVNGVTMTGTGTLTLSHTNSYSGSTTINAGILVAAANGAMGSATATGIVVNNGGALAFTGGVHYITLEPVTISGSGPAGLGAIENIGGTNTFSIPVTVPGTAVIGSVAGSLTLSGNIICQGAGITLTGAGAIHVSGNILLGPEGNLTDSGSGPATITGAISGTALSGSVQGLTGTYFNLPYGDPTSSLIYPAVSSNSDWLGNQTPAATAQLVGPIDFPDIADNGFADSLGDPAYYNLGGGNNNNVEARWYGEIMIPGTGTAPVPINFATTSDDGSMLYLDGNVVVFNNYNQGATERTGLANLTPGLHMIDVEYYQGYGGAVMDAQWDPTGGNNFVDIPNSAFFEPANSVIKTGSGTLTLSHTNSYLGSTTINAGTLVAVANGAMGPATAAGIVVNTGGALAFTGGLHYTTAEPITISGSGPAGNGAIENIGGTNTFSIPITLSDSATIGSDAGTMILVGSISAGLSTLTVVGAGTTTITGSIICQGGNVNLAGSGAINIAGNINLGPEGNLTDSSSGHDKITGVISGTATSGFVHGLTGTYFNLPAAGNLIQPADAGNSAWLGNQTPAVTAQLVGPIDFPDIADNGFADSVGSPAYYNIGGGNNNVEARWYGHIMIPGTGTAPVPINFATTSDDGSMLYIDGNAVVNNNNFQGPTQATGMADLTPGLHTIDVEYYQGGGGAVMDAQWDPTGGTNFVDIPNSAFGEPVNNLIKTGTGTLTLSSTDTYFGSTTVDAGKLVVDGHLLNTTVTVNGGGTLGGDGKVPATTVQTGGVLSPGDSPGKLTAASLSLATGSAFNEELGGTTAGSQYDQLVIPAGGTVALGGATLNVSILNGFVPTVGQQFTIIKNQGGGSVVGTFFQGSTDNFDGYVFGINYAGGAGHDVVLTVLSKDVTSQVSVNKSGLVYNRATELFGGNVTITNTGATDLIGALEVEVTGLPADVTLANASGTAPDGNPYIAIDLTGGVLAPGQSITFTVLFKNPKLLSFNYGIVAFDESTTI